MIRGGNKAFTIIEVMFFVAISATLIMVAMTTVGSKQDRAQFTDSMRSLESFINRQLSNTVNGVNDSPGDCGDVEGGKSENCINLGRVLVFENNSDQAKFYTIIGNRVTAEQEAACSGASRLTCANPRIELLNDGVSEDENTYDLIWGSTFIGGKHLISTQYQDSKAFGFLRDPRASAINTITYTEQTDTIAQINDTSIYSSETVYGSVDAYYCFASSKGGLKAAIVLTGSQVELVFDPVAPQYNC